jgi:hypothetical protein
VGGCFPEHNIGTSKFRWNMSPLRGGFITENGLEEELFEGDQSLCRARHKRNRASM